jgi:hypothetical protein
VVGVQTLVGFAQVHFFAVKIYLPVSFASLSQGLHVGSVRLLSGSTIELRFSTVRSGSVGSGAGAARVFSVESQVVGSSSGVTGSAAVRSSAFAV